MRVAVIGSGIQGSCVAMELGSRNVDVDLIEAKSLPMEGASRHSEGKIHLGFVYANDASLRTADLLMRGAAVFGRLMHEWLGTEFDDLPVSTAFNYAVHKQSLIPPQHLARTYQEISSRIRRRCNDGAYFGIENPGEVDRLSDSEIRATYATFS